MARLRYLLQGGTISDNPLSSGATTYNSTALASLPAVVSPDVAAVILYDPTGVAGSPEVVYITAHTASATSATILRAQEGTTARSHVQGEFWLNGPTTLDFLMMYSSPPTASFESQEYYDINAHQDYVWNGSAWSGDADEGLSFMQVGP